MKSRCLDEVSSLSRALEAMFAQTPLIPLIPLMRLPSPVTGNSYFFKKLKHKKTVKKLQTDLAIAKQEAAITVLELNEKIMTLCEGRPFPRGQYYHMTGAHWPLLLGDAYRWLGSKAQRQVLCLPGFWPSGVLARPGVVLLDRQHGNCGLQAGFALTF